MSAPAKSSPARVVIVGAGHAGVQAAQSLREAGHAGTVTLLSEERFLPYDRPPLSKSVITGPDTGPDGHALRAAAFYENRTIDLRQDCRARSIDLDRSEIVLDTNEREAFDHLILATGSRARELRVPGADLQGVVRVRTLSDAFRLRLMLQQDRLRVVIVGGGFIGLELAAAAVKLGHEVAIVEGQDRLLSRSVASEISHHVAAAHLLEGCSIALETSVLSLPGEGGHVTGVALSTGTVLPADVVIIGVGGAPNAELATLTGLDTCRATGGVLVDDTLLASDSRVSAIGDCATFPSCFAGGPTRLESVQNATDQARYVAARLVGTSDAPYAKVPWFWTDQYDMKIQIAGIAGDDDLRVTVGDPANGRFSVLRFTSNVLVAVDSVNRPADHMASRKILDSDRRPSPDDASRPGFELKAFHSST